MKAEPCLPDDGREMVARRLRETRSKLKAAERRGDQRYAKDLRATLNALVADARRVDGGRS